MSCYTPGTEFQGVRGNTIYFSPKYFVIKNNVVVQYTNFVVTVLLKNAQHKAEE